MSKDITLIITNWNGAELLRECLPSIRAAVQYDTAHSYETMVIDDCSSDGSLDLLEKEFPWVRRERTPRNLGFQGANNYAAGLADSPLVMLLNNDIKLEEKALYFLARHFDPISSAGTANGVFAASGKIFGFDRTTFLYGNRGGYFRRGHFYLYEKRADDASQTLFACGGALMADRKRYLDLGGFDPMYHPLYYEEIDLSYRALKRGWEVLYEPASIAYHKVQGTITKQEKLKQIRLISARNNYLFVWKNILDAPLTREFIIYIPLFLLRDLFRLEPRFWTAIYLALKRLPAALSGRRAEKKAVRFSDRETLSRINGGGWDSKKED
ncbi:MAG: glycosyltransferase family 2 protein [Nitrospinae bacterium]|nr:glycosyltransferase family 2 protein [Nitrospinota bacterium]